MAVCLSALTGPAAFDTVGEPATLWHRWRIWKDEFKIFVIASGIDDPKQQRALFLTSSRTGRSRDLPYHFRGNDGRR